MHAHHVAALALVLAGGDHHVVALLDSHHVILSSTCDRIASSSPYLSKRSEHFGRERDDLHELLGAQLAGHGPEDARADRLVLVVQQHRGVAVEADQRAVGAANALAGARSEEHTSELQSLMRLSYAVFCFK